MKPIKLVFSLVAILSLSMGLVERCWPFDNKDTEKNEAEEAQNQEQGEDIVVDNDIDEIVEPIGEVEVDVDEEPVADEESVEEEPDPTPEPTDDPASEPTAEPTPELTPEPTPLPADPVKVEFQAEDGKNLVGYYYPSMYPNSPTLILGHWARGDQRDFCWIAPYFQNRQNENPNLMPGCDEYASSMPVPWLDPGWFPVMEEGYSFGVFTFDFRDFGKSESGISHPKEWNMDSLAGLETVAGLDGVDPMQLITGGFSIGADSAAWSCWEYNNRYGDGCVGVFSVSPGDYTGVYYQDVIDGLEEQYAGLEDYPNIQRALICLSANGDTRSHSTCSNASGEHYSGIAWDGNSHGMDLFEPGYEPNPLAIILDFFCICS